MNSRVVNISSLVILLSLLSFIAEMLAYYLIPLPWASVLLAGILALGISHFCLESSLDYDYCFIHAAFMVISTLAFAIVIYMIQPNAWIQYDFSLVFLVLVNWLMPFVYCTIRDLLDHGPRFFGYSSFFRRMTILFLAIYALTILKQYYITPILPPYEEDAFGAHNFVPFMSLAGHLEQMVRQGTELQPLAAYDAEIIALGIPFGFFFRIFLRKRMLPLRLLIFAAYPVLLEVLQYVIGLGRYDLDDISLSLIGILIGVLLFHLINSLFQSVANREFLMSREKLSNYFTSM